MLNFLTKNKKELTTANDDGLEVFRNILIVATTILESDSPKRIFELIYSLGKPYQFQVINACIKGKPQSSELARSIEHLFFKNSNKYYRFFKVNTTGNFINYTNKLSKKTIHPSDSLVYSFPWHVNRLCDAFGNIGEKAGNKWKHDPQNHRVTHIRPLNIGYVTNGNHSSVMNIINNEAPMNITEELDLAPVYDEIYTDGQYFRRIQDESIVDDVVSAEFAAIFEIGRLILNKNLEV